jgi:RNA polymerase sigma-70 factor (sigma-E family)
VLSEPEGFGDFVAARSPALLRTAWLLTNDAQLAEDLLQTALARTWPKWSRLHPDGDPEAYVRRAMINTATSWRGRRWRGEHSTGSLPERPVADEFGAVDERDELASMLGALPARQRAVLVLRYVEDRTEQQTADLLGCSVGTVKSQTSRALSRLRATSRDSRAPSRAATDGST